MPTRCPCESTTGKSFRLLFLSCSSACSNVAESEAVSKSLQAGKCLIYCFHLLEHHGPSPKTETVDIAAELA